VLIHQRLKIPDTETWDAFIARTRKIPVVRDGGFDTQVKR